MPRAFFRTTASFGEGNVAKRHKFELELDEFSEPSQLSPEAKVHCVVTAMNDSQKGHRYFNCQIADGKTFR